MAKARWISRTNNWGVYNEELPHFSTVSYDFRHRLTEETIEAVFQWILNEKAIFALLRNMMA